jgi:hypothetical protein
MIPEHKNQITHSDPPEQQLNVKKIFKLEFKYKN